MIPNQSDLMYVGCRLHRKYERNVYTGTVVKLEDGTAAIRWDHAPKSVYIWSFFFVDLSSEQMDVDDIGLL